MTHDLLPALTDRTGRHPLTVDGVTLSPEELLGAASATAAQLRGRSRVAVNATPTMETVVAVVAGLLAGVQVLPVPPDSGAAELRHVLADSSPDLWLGPTPSEAARAEGPDLQHLPIDLTARAAPEPVPSSPDDIAFVLYTSGTTGLPKGVLIPRRAVAAGLDGLIDAWAWTADDVLAHGLPLFHVHGLILGVLGPLRVGGGLVHTGKGTPDRYAEAGRNGATMFFGVPTIWSRVAEAPEHAEHLRGARLLVSGSAGLPVPVFERIEQLTGHQIVERYGMSETLITVATRADATPAAGWVGVPITGVETRLRDEDGNDVPHDGESVGQLQVRGTTVFSGYLNRPDATAESWTADDWFRTGDVACIAPTGEHRIVGRESVDLIKAGGYRIGAGEIESTLLGHPAVGECAVVGLPDPDLGQRIVAFIVARGEVADEAELATELTAYVGSELSAHKRPREVRFVAGLPRNEMGKIQKKKLS
ncbi:acyl-CoA synthetase [Nocardioides alcanivorans]|uniref:acyl-CoA synthetase n=1 Tax=Nocardioides alcanivorans TaxID=2897352 RepID=UPI001F363418|nr:acyl-CoA synthetase [Nocardioides alcanivorans]